MSTNMLWCGAIDCDHDNEDPEGQSLYAFIDTSKLTALNESITGSCVNPFKPYSKVGRSVIHGVPPQTTKNEWKSSFSHK
jgi:hypothetical protein